MSVVDPATAPAPPATAPGPGFVGQPLKRREDRRYVTGRARYVGDIQLPDMLHLAFVRSPVAHGRIAGIDATEALQVPGVVAVRSGAELAERCKPIRADTGWETWQGSEQWPLATGVARFVGEAVAVVAATSRYRAEDGADAVFADIEPLPPVTTIDAALAEDAPIIHEGWADNCFVKRYAESGDVDAAFDSAPHVTSVRCEMGRSTGVPMETRGCIAHLDPGDGRLTLWSSHQMPHVLRTCVAELLGFPEHRIRVIAPDVGGGYGVKSNLYPEELVACMLAIELGRPVKWIEDRQEHMMVAAHARDHRHELELAYDDDGTVLAARARVWVDCGAYSLFPWTAGMEPGTVLAMLPGPYRIRTYRAEGYALATNKTPGGPYRGIGRVPICFTIERALDQIARDLGLDPLEVRRLNLVQPDEFPYATATGNVYDSGSYVESLDALAKAADLEGLRAWQRDERAAGRHVGIGMACFTEQTAHGVAEYVSRRVPLVFGYDKATVRMDASGGATLLVGIHSHGQGLETTLAQIGADCLGIDMDDVTVLFGDTDSCPYGNGTFGSRSAVLCGGAVELAARKVRDKLIAVGAYLMNADPESVTLGGGRLVSADGSSAISVAEIAHTVLLRPERLPPSTDPVLEAVASYDAQPGRGTYSNAAHLVAVEVDVETGRVNLLRYVTVDDCGRMLNPMIVEGQVHGAVCQGVGGALYEDLPYDEQGNPLATTFLDYLMPNATDLPDIEVVHLETPSPFTIHGTKGVGESGTIGCAPAIAAAIEDALAPLGPVFVGRTPLSPESVLAYADAARAAGGAAAAGAA